MFPSGDIFRDARRAMGLSQLELASKVGLSRVTIINIEKDQPNVSKETLRTVATFLGLSEISSNTAVEADTSIPFLAQITKIRADFESKEITAVECIRNGELLRDSVIEYEGDPFTYGEYYLLMAEMYNTSHRYSDGRRCALIAVETFNVSKDAFYWAKAYFESARSEYGAANFGAALDRWLVIEERISHKRIDVVFMTKLFTSIAIASIAVNNSGMMSEYIGKAAPGIEYFPESERDLQRAKMEYLRGEEAYRGGSYKDADAHFARAAVYYRDLNDNRNVLRMQNNMAEARLRSGDARGAERVALDVLKEKTNLGESNTIIAESLLLLAEIHYVRDQHGEANELIGRLLSLGDVDVTRVARAKRTKARISYRNGNIEEFNSLMTEAADILNHQSHKDLAVEIFKEYCTANHLKTPSVFNM